MKIAQDQIINSVIGKMISFEKYKLVDKNIIAEVVKDVIQSLIYEEII